MLGSTDNARTERFYGTIKQEEIYLVGDYQDEETANVMISRSMNYYNNERPHQSLWNYTPNQIDIMNNKTALLKQLSCLKIECWTKRKNYWKTKTQTNPSHLISEKVSFKKKHHNRSNVPELNLLFSAIALLQKRSRRRDTEIFKLKKRNFLFELYEKKCA